MLEMKLFRYSLSHFLISLFYNVINTGITIKMFYFVDNCMYQHLPFPNVSFYYPSARKS